MTRFRIRTRDWKGTYEKDSSLKGWKILAGENEIQTGCDSFAEVFVKGKVPSGIIGQDIYDTWQALRCGEEQKGFELDNDDHILILKESV